MRQPNDECKRQTGTKQKDILGIKIKHYIIDGLEAGRLGEYLGDYPDKDKVDEKSEPYIVPVHYY